MDLEAREPEYADLIEGHVVAAIEGICADLSDGLGISEFGAYVHSILQPYVRPCAEVMAASLVAGETAEQFAERLDALKIKVPLKVWQW